MNRFQLSVFLAAAVFVSTARAAEPQPFELRDGDRVAFIGGTFVECEQSYSHLETLLQSHWPGRKISFRNLGWSGDNVFGASRGYFEGADAGFARLTKITHDLKPTVIFVSYGMTESFDGEAGREKFRAGLERMLDMLKDIGARETVLVGPIRHENLHPPLPDPAQHNESLRAYADTMKDVAKQRGHRFVDLYDLTGVAPALTSNGIHLTEAGYWHAARAIESRLGLRGDENLSRTPDGSIGPERFETMRRLAIRKNVQYFNQWRPANETYIFGFRQHEQGRNAAEMPQFSKPIEELEVAMRKAAQGETVEVEDAAVPKPTVVQPPDPEIERKTFKVADGFEVNLWAADPLLAKPIQMNWDPQGRLWIASSSMYPQIRPGEVPTDKVIVLEDTNDDGKADKSTVFADGLLIPTGVAPGDGGAYVANSTELVHLADSDGDLKADSRRVVLSGFGTEDTHHIIHTFHWGPDARLYFNQSIYIHSHVETPWGTKRLMAGGTWRFRPESYQLDVFTRGLVNGWGHSHDRWGESFGTDGAGGEGIHYMFPGAAWVTAKDWGGIQDMPRILKGLNPGSPKYCANEVVSGRHLPDDWQGNIVTNDFRANRVVRCQIVDEKGTFVSKQMPDVITSTDVAFRPVDVRMGPDGAIYVADFYNPIINHGEVDFRDPRRDKTHGRIWRISAKNRPLVKRPALAGASVESLLDQLKAPEGWTRQQAKLVLRSMGASAVIPALGEWLKNVDARDADSEHHRVEALWVHQALDVPQPALLAELLQSKTPQARVAATRVVADWADRLPDAVDLLAARAIDGHPRVRIEAVRGLSRIGTARAFELALGALDRGPDPLVEYALWVTANETKSAWLPEFQAGRLRFGGNAAHLTFALGAVKAPEALAPLVAQIRDGKTPPDARGQVIELIASAGSASDVRVLYEIATDARADSASVADALAGLEKASRQRGVMPDNADAANLAPLASSADASVRIAAMRLAGAWRASVLRDTLASAATGSDTPADVRRVAIDALAELGPESADTLRVLDAKDRPFDVRAMAVAALSSIDVNDASARAAALLADAPADADPSPLMAAFSQREGGGDALAAALASKQISPDVAKLCLRYINSTGRDLPALTQRLRESAGLGGEAQKLTPEQLAETMKDVLAKGDAARGELVFRRGDMNCYQCHAIAGAGGSLGPDLRAIGASSPLDYLIESIVDPNKAVKDGYQSVVIATTKGEVFSGIKVSQDDSQTILRDALHDRIVIPRASVRRERTGGSLMPAGLADTLTRQEFLDLLRFLSELGKPGPYQSENAMLVRRWRVLGKDQSESSAVPAYAMASGVLPIEAVASVKDQTVAVVRADIDVTAGGRIGLRIGNPNGIALRVSGWPIDAREDVEIELARGAHTLQFQIDLAKRSGEGLRVELHDLPGSSGHAQPVGGR